MSSVEESAKQSLAISTNKESPYSLAKREESVVPAIISRKTGSLSGAVGVSGSKNVGLKLLTTTPMFDKPLFLVSVPRNNQVRYLIDLLRSFGTSVSVDSDTPLGFNLTIRSDGLSRDRFEYCEIRRCRHMFLLAVSVLARSGKVSVPMPGYSHYGARPIDGQLAGLRKMGVRVSPVKEGMIQMEIPSSGLRGAEVFLPFPSNAVTEALLWAAVAAEGTTIIHGAAQEPETIELAKFFQAADVEIRGVGTSELVIHGRGLSALRSPGDYRIIPDRIEVATLGAAIALCGGQIRLVGVRNSHLAAVRAVLGDLGVRIVDEGEDTWLLSAEGRPNAANISTGPFPGFPTDALGPYIATLSVAQGASVVQERMWTNRLSLASELKRLGAEISSPSGQVAIIQGVAHLSGAPVIGTDPRATAALMLAGLYSGGETTVFGVDLLDNAYDGLDEKLRRLGARVSRTVVSADDFHHVDPTYGRLEAF